MLINRKRGEISADLGGKERALCLTLGALAELEAHFGADDLTALTQRFSSGKLSGTCYSCLISSEKLSGSVSDSFLLGTA